MIYVITLVIILILIASVYWAYQQEEKGQRELQLFSRLETFVRDQPSQLLKQDGDRLSREGWKLLEDIVVVAKETDGETLAPRYRRGRIVISRLPISATKPGRWGYLAPTFLTMLGIWGTFWGINVGLAKTNIAGQQSTAGLMQGAQTLFSGMQTAFFTSLAGMGSAMVTMALVAWMHHRYFQRTQKLQQIVQSIFICEPPTAYLARLSKNIETLQEKLDQMVSISQQQDLVSHLQIAVSEITTQVGDIMERPEQPPNMENSLEALREFIS